MAPNYSRVELMAWDNTNSVWKRIYATANNELKVYDPETAAMGEAFDLYIQAPDAWINNKYLAKVHLFKKDGTQLTSSEVSITYGVYDLENGTWDVADGTAMTYSSTTKVWYAYVGAGFSTAGIRELRMKITYNSTNYYAVGLFYVHNAQTETSASGRYGSLYYGLDGRAYCVNYTAARATKLDYLDAAISSVGSIAAAAVWAYAKAAGKFFTERTLIADFKDTSLDTNVWVSTLVNNGVNTTAYDAAGYICLRQSCPAAADRAEIGSKEKCYGKGDGALTIEFDVRRTDAVGATSSAVGLDDSNSVAPIPNTDNITLFAYAGAASSFYISKNASYTTSDTFTMTQNQWFSFRLELNADWTQLLIYKDDVLFDTITTNIPDDIKLYFISNIAGGASAVAQELRNVRITQG